MMDKIDVVLDLVREGKITNEQAKVLLSDDTNKGFPFNESTFVPYPVIPYQPSTINPWYYTQPYVVTC